MTAHIDIEKHPKHGWQARSVFHLGIKIDGKSLVLNIISNKPKEGGIASVAMVYHMDQQGGLEHHVGQDYQKLVMYDPKARCTQNKMQEQHSGALRLVQILAAEALAVYQTNSGAPNRDADEKEHDDRT